MKTPFAAHASRLGTRSSLLVALAAAALVGCGGKGAPDTAITKAPTITTQPQNIGTSVGESATFRVSASGRGLSYQWFKGNAPINGATGSAYTISAVSTADFGTYYVRVANDAGEIASGFATLGLPVTGAPTITTQPNSVETTAGSSAQFTVAATGAGALSYQWFRNGAAVAGATGATYTIPSVSQTNVGSYYVVVTNDKGSTTSSTVALSIVAPSAPTIRTQPISKTVTLGSSTSFTVAAKGSPTLTYQWFKNGAAIPGATGTTYAVGPVVLGSAGDYYVVVTNSLGSVQSATASLTIGLAPEITQPPANKTANVGAEVVLSVTATGTAPLTYQWFKIVGASNEAIPGATSSTLTFSSVTLADAGEYKVVVTNDYGSATSRPNTVLTIIGPPTITDQPDSVTVGLGQPATFTVVATGTGALSYQWYKNGALITGQTSSTYTIPNTVATDAATYTVRVTNAAGTTTSNGAVLKVIPAPTITTQPTPLTVNAGANAAFTVVATGTGTLTYQWYKNGVLITGATSATLTLTAVTEADEAAYKVVVTDSGVISTTSNTVNLTVN